MSGSKHGMVERLLVLGAGPGEQGGRVREAVKAVLARLPTADLTRAPLVKAPAREELMRPGPYLVGRKAADGSVHAVLQRGLSWARACRLLEPLPEDFVIRIEAPDSGRAS